MKKKTGNYHEKESLGRNRKATASDIKGYQILDINGYQISNGYCFVLVSEHKM